jgi:hypothetical protein
LPKIKRNGIGVKSLCGIVIARVKSIGHITSAEYGDFAGVYGGVDSAKSSPTSKMMHIRQDLRVKI